MIGTVRKPPRQRRPAMLPVSDPHRDAGGAGATPAKSAPREGDLKVWWIPQVPMKNPFEVSVPTIAEGRRLIEMLADYDLFQYRRRIKPDYSNAGGLMVYRDGDWEDVDDDEQDGDRPSQSERSEAPR